MSGLTLAARLRAAEAFLAAVASEECSCSHGAVCIPCEAASGFNLLEAFKTPSVRMARAEITLAVIADDESCSCSMPTRQAPELKWGASCRARVLLAREPSAAHRSRALAAVKPPVILNCTSCNNSTVPEENDDAGRCPHCAGREAEIVAEATRAIERMALRSERVEQCMNALGLQTARQLRAGR